MDMAQCGLSCSLFPVPHSLLSASTASSVSLKHTEHVPTFLCSSLLVSPFCLDFQSVLCSNATPKNFPDYTLDPGQPYDPSCFLPAVLMKP